MDSSDISKPAATVFYPLEKDIHETDCQIIDQFKEKYDTRYTSMGLEISEYEVQKENKVLSKLEQMPNYALYEND